jgi:hypothetical protein
MRFKCIAKEICVVMVYLIWWWGNNYASQEQFTVIVHKLRIEVLCVFETTVKFHLMFDWLEAKKFASQKSRKSRRVISETCWHYSENKQRLRMRKIIYKICPRMKWGAYIICHFRISIIILWPKYNTFIV